MPYTIQDVEVRPSRKQAQKPPKIKSLPRELLQLTAQLFHLQDLYTKSLLSQSINRQLHGIVKAGTSIARVVSLGLGSLIAAKGQSRRLKQLAILISIRQFFQEEQQHPVEMYAQDPAFTRSDEALLAYLGIQVLRTPSGSDLGEAAPFISPSTLVYSPFLTLEAYEQLILRSPVPVQYVIGDDFDALLRKWPKHSSERKQVDGLMRSGLSKYARKAVAGEGFWTEEDETFPMAAYSRLGTTDKVKARM